MGIWRLGPHRSRFDPRGYVSRGWRRGR